MMGPGVSRETSRGAHRGTTAEQPGVPRQTSAEPRARLADELQWQEMAVPPPAECPLLDAPEQREATTAPVPALEGARTTEGGSQLGLAPAVQVGLAPAVQLGLAPAVQVGLAPAVQVG